MTLISAMPSVLMKHLCWRLWFYSSDHKFFLPPHWALSKDDGSYLFVLCERWTGPPGGCWEALRWGWFFWGSVPDLSQWAPWWRSWLQINATRAIGARLDGWVCQSCVQHSFGFHLLMLQWPASHHCLLSSASHHHVISRAFLLFIGGEWNDYTSHVHLSITLTEEENIFLFFSASIMGRGTYAGDVQLYASSTCIATNFLF